MQGGAYRESRHVYFRRPCFFIAGAVIQWLRDNLQIISDSSESEKMAVHCEDNGGVVFVPSFTGLGAPYCKADVKGAVFGVCKRNKQRTNCSYCIRIFGL